MPRPKKHKATVSIDLPVEVDVKSRIHDCRHCIRCIDVNDATGRIQCGRHPLEVAKGVVSVVPYQNDCRFYTPKRKVVTKGVKS